MSTFVVVGGGVSGMAAARSLAGGEALRDEVAAAPGAGTHRVILLESGARLGGKVLTGSLDGGAVELGPDQFLRRDPSAERWCRRLGLGGGLVPPSARTAGVWAGGAVRALPAGLVLGVPTDLSAVAASGILSAAGLQRAAEDARLAGHPLTAAEVGLEPVDAEGRRSERSAGEILRTRLGDEAVDRLVDPLLGGINAGSIDSLSLGTVAPSIAAALVGEREVIQPLSRLVPPAGAASPFFGLTGGLGQLATAAGEELRALGVEVRCSSAAEMLEVDDAGRWRLTCSDGSSVTADGVVLAVPAPAAARLLAGPVPAASRELAAVPTASVAVTTLGFPADLEVPDGWSGLLVPRVEGFLVSAVTFLSQKWPWMGAAQPGAVSLLRLSAGRFGDDRPQEMDDETLVEAELSELARLVPGTGRPVSSHVQRWPDAFPQYLPGHRGRVAAARTAVRSAGGLALAGALLGGIGVPACVSSGEAAAVELLGLAEGRLG